jgi:hypothetical protein
LIAAEVINQNSNDDDDICFVLDKHAELDVYRLLKQLSVCVEMFFHNLDMAAIITKNRKYETNAMK